MNANFRSENLKEKVYMSDPGSEKLIILMRILVEIAWEEV